MSLFEAFVQGVHDTLAHLYDPAYRPAEILWTVMGCDPQQGSEAIRATLIRAIEDLKPASDVPPTARVRRIYGLLHYRYVQDLTQEETAERLGITPRHLRREQREAAYVLAQRLWEQGGVENLLAAETVPEQKVQPQEWRSQLRQELASLRDSAPDIVADVGETIRSTAGFGSILASKHDVSLEVGEIQSNLSSIIHPSVLRQILIMTIGQLAQWVSSGQIVLSARHEEGRVEIIITGHPAAGDGLPGDSLIREVLTIQGGTVDIVAEGDRISFQIELPSVDKAILAVDDNLDMIRLYQRYVVGTRYRIVQATKGQSIFDTVEASAPDVIVLDVMLPDVDGWELLTNMHEHPATRDIPVIVCSVIREEALALALGAALYLPKPVQRQEFIQALDQALGQRSNRA